MAQTQPASLNTARDSRLLARLVTGDDAALGEVYDEYGRYVYGLALRVLRDPRIAEDVAQEVFVSLWERPQGYDAARGTLRAYLGVVAHRRAVDEVRRRTAARAREEREAARVDLPPEDVADIATNSVVAAAVRDAVTDLPEDQRRCIELAYFGGHSYREVARMLDIPEGTAKSRLRLGLRRLAESLSALGVTP